MNDLRTYVYVDGFNLYYRALKRTRYKWLDLVALSGALLSPDNRIDHVRYFTAPVSGKRDPGQPVRQQMYLRALKSTPDVTIHLGSFLNTVKSRPLANPVPGHPTHVDILNSEEKGSDVNLASYLIHDAWRNLFDVALVFSQDTDLLEPIRIVREEISKQVGVVVLDGKAPGRLAQAADFQRHLTSSRLAAAQFPDIIQGNKGKLIQRPAAWSCQDDTLSPDLS